MLISTKKTCELLFGNKLVKKTLIKRENYQIVQSVCNHFHFGTNMQCFESTKSSGHSPLRAGEITPPPRNVCIILIDSSFPSTNFTVLLTSLIHSHFYSDLTRNYLNGTIPPQWGSLNNLVNMYDISS